MWRCWCCSNANHSNTLAGSIRRHLHSSIPTALDGLRVPERIHGVDWPSRHYVLIPLLRLLQAELQREAKKTESGKRQENIIEWKNSLQ